MFKNPQNGYTEKTSLAFLWALLFAPIYFAYKNMYGMALISFIAAMCTAGVSNFLFALVAKGELEKHYLKKGWVKCD